MKTQEKAAMMGQVVTVHKGIEKCTKGSERTIRPFSLRKPFTAWVVGFSMRHEGRIRWGAYDDPTSFRIEKSIPVLLVRRSPIGREIAVPMDGFTVGGEISNEPLVVWTENDRKYWSDIVKEWPRDERGRFVKQYDEHGRVLPQPKKEPVAI